jgi:hypothetical protein
LILSALVPTGASIGLFSVPADLGVVLLCVLASTSQEIRRGQGSYHDEHSEER